MLRKPVFWIVFPIISIGCIFFTLRYFSQAFPLVTLDLQMDRQVALKSARALSGELRLGPEGFSQAASFRLDRGVQHFVELEAGGNAAFSRMLEAGLYSPYTWRVRHFKEGETNEVLIRFTPRGAPYGFREKLPEDEPGASLTSDSARAIAERAAGAQGSVDLTAYELVETSQRLRPGGRTDHTFVYERPDVTIQTVGEYGEGRYRLRLVVGGDRLIELTHFVKIPEAFSRRYEEMRSANNTIGSVALIAAAVLYILGGCVVGLFFLLRQGWVLWRRALFLGLFVAFLQVLVGINNWPLAWMNYDTALSATGFLLRQVIVLLVNFIFLGTFFSLIFMAAESLSRKAFPHHLQQWRLWSPGVANSPAILGRTVGGFLLVGIFFAFEVAFYFFSTRVLGWWTPSEALFHPDVLATYFPWLTSIAVSLQAGFTEESLFRAVPIAGAALIGQRFGHRRAWIVGAFFLQALVFGAAHAYTAQPAYARLVELIIPSLGFGLLYLYFGLLPAIVLHFAFDVVWFALPLFVSAAPGVWIDQLLVVILTLVPLWLVLGQRWHARQWVEVPEEEYNRSWAPPEKEVQVEEEAPAPSTGGIGPTVGRLLLIGGLAGLVLWLLAADFQDDAPALTVGRSDAKGLAREALADQGVELPVAWRALSSISAGVAQPDRFIWQAGDEEVYHDLMAEYLPPPHWRVRFARFEGDLAERAEEFQVFVAGAGHVYRLRHRLPEARAAASIAEDEARIIAHTAVRNVTHLDPLQLKEVSAVEAKLPNRRDWTFTFADTAGYPLSEGEARIAVRIAGDQVGDTYRFVHVPEEWARQERNQRNLASTISLFCGMVISMVMLAGAIGGIVSWSRKNFPVRLFWTFFGLLFGLGIIALINGWPTTLARFSTAQPLANQFLSAIGFSLLGSLFLAASVALIIGFVHAHQGPQAQPGGTRLILWGISLGTLAAGLGALMAWAAPSLSPSWAQYAAVGGYLPVLAAGLGPLPGYIISATLFLLVFTAVDRFTRGWRHRRGLFSAALVLLGLVITGAGSIESLPFWLVSGLLAGGTLLLAYLLVLRFHIALIPLALAAMVILDELQQALYQAHPAAIPGAIAAAILMGGLAVFWVRKLGAGDQDLH